MDIISRFMPFGTTYQNPVESFGNFNYLGEIYMGSEQQKLGVIWDTGSGGLAIGTSECSNCIGDTFQIEQSTSFAWVEPAEFKTTKYQDGTTLEGRWATDQTCATSGAGGSCAFDFKFNAIKSQYKLVDYSNGIIGLWSGNSLYAKQDEIFMNKLMASSDISEKIFSFYLTGVKGQSYIDFGAPNQSVMASKITYIDIKQSLYWMSEVTGFRFPS